jgi:Mn2+/Fe2+ NRAMP family transporter
MSGSKDPKGVGSVLLGSAFLMATSAIGPGFITQTTVFTNKLTTNFGFVILCSILLDIIVQLNIWRVISVSGLRAQDLANRYLPGSGFVLAVLVGVGGLAFNIGNVAGAGMGIQVISGLPIQWGAVISASLSLLVFWYKEVGKAVDVFAKVLGILMIGLTAYIAVNSQPPVLEAIHHTFMPEVIDTTAIIILVGGTVGGYISFAGAHRLLDAAITGKSHLREVSKNSVRGIILASVMRLLLFFAALGVVMHGGILDEGNPAASVFRIAAGKAGYIVFGIVLWAASITSVVGSAYTSVSFIRTLHPNIEKYHSLITTCFIVFSALIFLLVGRPVNILVIVGAINGFILPFALAIILLASRKKLLMGDYNHPNWLTISGWCVVAILTFMSLKTMIFDFSALWR